MEMIRCSSSPSNKMMALNHATHQIDKLTNNKFKEQLKNILGSSTKRGQALQGYRLLSKKSKPSSS
jgi:hypothetical protein